MDQLNKVIPLLKESSGSIEYYDRSKKTTRKFPEVFEDVLRVVDYLDHEGIRRHQRVGVIAKNCYEWVVLDLACLAMGAILVPFDVNHEGSPAELISFFELSLLFTNLERHSNSLHLKLRELDHLTEWESKNEHFIPVEHSPDDIITFKFTSGTTSTPKSIETKKKSIDDCMLNIQEMFHHNNDDKLMIFMPLYLLQQRFFIYSSVIYNYKIILIPFEYVFMSMKKDKPTVILGVPHIYESLYKTFIKEIEESFYKSIQYKLYLLLQKIASLLSIKTSYKPFKKILGGSIRYLWTGSAPINIETLKFFFKMGVPIYQGYGTCETGIITKNFPNANKIGSVGKLLRNREIKFDKDNQILIKNTHAINDHYFKTGEEENRGKFLGDGFVATGDTGFMDKDGFLYINGRLKDLIVFSNGRKVHPTQVEKRVQYSKLIKHCVVYGDNKPYLVALLVPDEDIPGENLRVEVDSINSLLSSDEKIYKFLVVSENFSLENNMLNAQRKVRRNYIIEKYKKELEELYE